MALPRRLVERFGPEDTRLAATLVVISAAAWLLMLLLGHTVTHGTHGTHAAPAALPDALSPFEAAICTSDASGAQTDAPASWAVPSASSWLAGWAIMVVAMMLPPALPLLRALSRLAGTPASRRALLMTAGLCFLLVWVLAGAVLLAGGSALSQRLRDLPALAQQPALLSGLAALAAGAYQFTPWKNACLRACRSPTGLLLLRWRADRPMASAVQIGIAYGLVCIGCCWALMLLTLTVGALALPVMVIASVLMLLERVLPSVRRLVGLQAAFACLVGLLLLSGAVAPGLAIGPARAAPSPVETGNDHVRHATSPSLRP